MKHADFHSDIQSFCTAEGPAFFYTAGPSGCGKTQCLCGIQACNEQMGGNALYIEAHRLCGYLIEAYQSKTYPALVKLLSNYDMILVDQMEDIAGKWNTFNSFLGLFGELLGQGVSVAVSLCIRANRPEDAQAHRLLQAMRLCEHKFTACMV